MMPTDPLQQHRQLCDELYQLALEENLFLKEKKRPTDAAILDRKRSLLDQLTTSLDALRAGATGNPGDPVRREIIEKSKTRILQILHLDRENEQLLLRYSLSRGTPPPAPAPASPTQLQKLYERHS